MRDNLNYLAGIIDGEGTIGILRNKRSGYFTYQQRLEVANTDTRLINWLLDNFGGSYSNCYKSSPRHKDAYKWAVYGKKSYKIFKNVLSYLLLKQEQAVLAIELYEKVSRFKYGRGRSRPKYKTRVSEELYQRCKELNKRGIDESEQIVEPKLIRKVTTLEEFE